MRGGEGRDRIRSSTALAIRAESLLLLENILPALDTLDPSLPPEALLNVAVEANVRWTVQKLLESAEGKARAAQGDMKVGRRRV